MHVEQKREALILTQKIMETWYHGDSALVCEYLDEDVIWIGSTDNQFFVGRSAVLEALRMVNEKILNCSLSQQNYILGSSGEDTCLCVGRYVATLDTYGMYLSEPQRVSFLWKVTDGRLAITHIHVSNVTSVCAPDEEFPIRASRMNYQYVQKKLREQDEILKVATTDYAYHLISKQSILRVESDNANVTVYDTEGKAYRVHTQLQIFLQENCPDFIRIHRSHAVNPYHISMLKNQKVTLDNGTVLPISRSYYASTMEQLDRLFKGTAQEAQTDE